MLSNYMTIIFRKLRKEKLYSFVNIFGLTIGLTAFLLIALYVRNELSFDQFHEKKDTLYRVYETNLETSQRRGYTPPDFAEYLAKDIPAVEGFVRMGSVGGKSLLQYGNIGIYADKGFYVDPNFFELFDFKLIEGTRNSVFSNPHNTVLTKDLAERIFGNENPVGKTIKLDKEKEVLITGVCENPPKNSIIQFNFLIAKGDTEMLDTSSEGYYTNLVTYLYFNHPPDLGKVTQLINESAKKTPYYEIFVEGDEFGLLPFTDQRLRSGFSYDSFKTGDIKFIYLFTGIGLVILLLAVINYINMVTARAVKRAKEIGLRKIIGAQKSQLIKYQLLESIIVTLIALFIAFVITERLLPIFNQLTNKSIELNYFGYEFLLFVPIFGVLLGLLTGLYPSFYIARYKPLVLIKGNQGTAVSKNGLRRVLVGFQFVVASIMILVTIIMQAQMRYISQKDLGFDQNQLVYIPLFEDLKGNSQVLKNEILTMPNVASATITGWMFGAYSTTTRYTDIVDMDSRDRPPKVGVTVIEADPDVVKTFGLKVVEKKFDFDFDQLDTTNMVITATVVEKLNWEESPIGKYLYDYSGNKREIVAVVSDFHSASMKTEMAPTVIENSAFRGNENLLIKFDNPNIQATLLTIQSKYEALLNRPFEYQFVDVAVQKYYQEENQQVAMFNTFSGLAIFISLLGLLAMTIYSAELRRKEVSIRKVLGASIKQLILLMNKEHIALIVLAFLVATPISIYAIQDWLTQFKYRIGISPVLFVLALLGFICLNLLVTLFFSLKVSSANPADTLREE